MNWKHWALLLGTPCAVAFLDYLQNVPVWDAKALTHAGIATALVGLGILAKSPLQGAS